MEIKKYRINDEEFTFDFLVFNDLFSKKKAKEKKKTKDLEIDLAENVYKSSDAVHNWRFKINSPSDLETIKLIASYFNIENYMTFLKRKDVLKLERMNDLQIVSAKRVYDSILNFLEEFDNSNGFNDCWFDLKEDPKEREGLLYDIALSNVDKVISVYKKEYLMLKNTELYSELGNYIYNDLYEIFDGKLSYAYRFEAIPSNGITTEEDYSNALNKLNCIIDKYIQF